MSLNVTTHKDELVRYFARHFVSLAFLWEKEEKKDTVTRLVAGSFSVSGFIISVCDTWFWISVGHAIDQIENNLIAQGRRIVRCGFIDSWGTRSKYHEPVPVEYAFIKEGRIQGEEGFDSSAVPLSMFYRDALAKNGVEPLTEKAWRGVPSVDAIQSYFLLGIPRELNREVDANRIYDGRLTISEAVTFHYVEPLRKLPPHIDWVAKPRLFGRIQLKGPSDLADIEGMSGGPLFAMMKGDDGETHYWVAGIQSSWFKKDRIITATPLEPVATALERHLHRL